MIKQTPVVLPASLRAEESKRIIAHAEAFSKHRAGKPDEFSLIFGKPFRIPELRIVAPSDGTIRPQCLRTDSKAEFSFLQNPVICPHADKVRRASQRFLPQLHAKSAVGNLLQSEGVFPHRTGVQRKRKRNILQFLTCEAVNQKKFPPDLL